MLERISFDGYSRTNREKEGKKSDNKKIGEAMKSIESIPCRTCIVRAVCNGKTCPKISWYIISKHKTLTENFIKEYQDKVDWDEIVKHQALSEDFIKEFINNLYWPWISRYQILSESFIREFKDDKNVYWPWIYDFQKLTESFREEFEYKLK